MVFIYGLALLAQFYFTICILDILFFSFNTKWIKEKIIIEWTIIVIPFIIAAIEYHYWSWLTISAIFLATQLFRKKQILKILSEQKNGIQQ